jgi:diacylglycerol kinase (ATP)
MRQFYSIPPLRRFMNWVILLEIMETRPSTSPHAFLVINPISGLSNPQHIQQKFQQHFTEAGWTTSTYQTTGKENLKQIVQDAVRKGANLVVAAGGDGTISAVADGLVNTDIPLGILPTGTWNALARNLGIPTFNIDEAFRILLSNHTLRKIDGFVVKDRIYLLNLGIGLSSTLIGATDREQKRRLGFFAYLKNLLIHLFGLQLRGFRLEVDGAKFQAYASEVMLVNSSLVGLGELPTPLNIYPDDGKLELCVVRSRSIAGYFLVAWDIALSRRGSSPQLRVFPAQDRVRITTRKPMVVQADGEIIGTTPLDIKIHPGAVWILVPEKPIALPVRLRLH